MAALVGSMGTRPHKNPTCARNRPTASCCGTPTGRADEDDGSLSRLGAWTGRGLSKTAHSCPFRVAATASRTRIVPGDLAFPKPIGHFCGHRRLIGLMCGPDDR
jgi:hypothetical protein